MKFKLSLTLSFLMVAAPIQHFTLAGNNPEKSDTTELHLLGDSFDIKTGFPIVRESKKPQNALSNELLSSSFPAFFADTEAATDDAVLNSFSLINLLTGIKIVLHRFPKEYLTGMVGGIDETHIFVSTYRRKYDGKFQIWRVDKTNSDEAKFVVEARSLHFSARCGKLAYVGNKNQLQVRRNDGIENTVALNSDFPVIFPNCKAMIFGASSHGLHKLIFYSETSPTSFTKRTLVSSLIKEFDPLIRVSKNSKYLAFKYKSDIFTEPVRVVRISDGKEIYATGHLPIKNWFFSD
jgi:hypothetical protein